MHEIASAGATVACAIFAGAAVYITVVEHPASMATGPVQAVAHFREMYSRAALMQGSLALIGATLSLLAWLAGASVSWLAFGAVLGSVIPWTLAVMLPTNNRLESKELEHGSREAEKLLVRWGRMHALRTVTSLVALAGMLTLLTR